MNIKNILDKTGSFLLKRLSELIGASLLVLSILLLISLVSYSPEDPNFIFPKNAEIKNLLGAKGSYTSDMLFQSIGLISLLVPISFLFISVSIIIDKNILLFIESLFFVILYSITGALFFTIFHTETYWLTINGNNGFVGNLFKGSSFINLLTINTKISYVSLIILISVFFLLSINFKFSSLKILKKIFTKSEKKTSSNMSENFDENSVSDTGIVNNETRIQENFSFEKKITPLDKKNHTI